MKYLSTYQHYIFNETLINIERSRGSVINKEEMIDILKKNCKEFLEDFIETKKPKIFRGLQQSEDYKLIKPSESIRTSKNTSNHYTLIVDNSIRWSEYPKRSKSLICTTEYNIAKNFGEVYIVIPFDNTKIGVCPESDFWGSFKKGFPEIGCQLRDFTYDLRSNNVRADSYENLLLDLSKLEVRLKENIEEFGYFKSTFDPNHITNTSGFFKNFNVNLSLYDQIDDAFDPNKNGFQLTNYSGLNNLKENIQHSYKTHREENLGFEIWSDSNCLLVKERLFKNLMKAILNKKNSFDISK